MEQAQKNAVPERSQISGNDKWNLSSLFTGDKAWEEALADLEKQLDKIGEFKGTLGKSAGNLAACLRFMNKIEMAGERLGYYAHLRVSEDEGSSLAQDMSGRLLGISSKLNAAASYQKPEILAIPEKTIDAFLEEPDLAEFKTSLHKLLRFKPHILSEKEEKLMALQTEANQTASNGFSALTNVDLDFGVIHTKQGDAPLTQSTFTLFLIDSSRVIRQKAYNQFYQGFGSHQHTLAALLAGSVQLDVYKARARGFSDARSRAMFPDRIPESVYDNLIQTISDNLPQLHRYYELRRRVLGLDKLAHYDVYAPLIKDIKVNYPYDKAADMVCESVRPLGEDYQSVLRQGLTGGWVDKYENKGKRSGAFSAGSFKGDPYILLNYKDNVMRDLFTLAHEAGHSMHSWFSAGNNSFQDYSYTIFEAEVASTFNEQLLAHFMLSGDLEDSFRAFILNKQIDDIVATIFRQTMFAEYELICHREAEEGRALTIDFLRRSYRRLLRKYFGEQVELPEAADLEGLRIPHFYRAFYVYKYATGLSAALALAEKVLTQGQEAVDAYRSFLKSGGSRYPLESLCLAGVDMGQPEPINLAMRKFGRLIKDLEKLIYGMDG